MKSCCWECKSRPVFTFTGRDAFGVMHDKPLQCIQKMRDMFTTHIDLAQDQHFQVPMPTYPRKPLSQVLTEELGFKISAGGLVTADQLKTASQRLQELEPLRDLTQLYLAQGNNTIQTKFGRSVQLQCGWLDGIGVYRHQPEVPDTDLDRCVSYEHSANATLTRYEAESSIMSFDHVPIRGTIQV